MEKPSRRTFNNIIIIGILLFIVLINLPTYLRSHLTENEQPELIKQQIQEGVIALFSSDIKVKSLQFADVTLMQGNPWQTNAPLTISATELANRWLNLVGTEVDSETYNKLKPNLPSPSMLVVGLEQGATLHLPYYQLPQFWLIQNSQKRWLAMSSESHYLFPFPRQDS